MQNQRGIAPFDRNNNNNNHNNTCMCVVSQTIDLNKSLVSDSSIDGASQELEIKNGATREGKVQNTWPKWIQ